jgi:fructan beta-fructosidase
MSILMKKNNHSAQIAHKPFSYGLGVMKKFVAGFLSVGVWPINLLTLLGLLTLSITLTSCLEQNLNNEVMTNASHQEHYRPQFHFSPKQNWMNDPNGLVYYDGEYHMFYQHNPFGNLWGNMSWGHAVSEDLVHWEELPLAIAPENDTFIFSGSAVMDYGNTSGLGTPENPAMVALYTGWHEPSRIQHQDVAYSLDKGRTWKKYEGNPVLDIASSDFRDPKVFWYAPQQKWLMLVVLATEHKVQFYESKDLRDWTFASEFGPAGSTGGVWEVPELLELSLDGNSSNKKWILKVDVGNGAVAGGSGGQYFVGQFDGTRFIPEEEPSKIRWLDYGSDFYAAITWSGLKKHDGRDVWLGWLSNWRYAAGVPTDPWRGAQSIPRSLGLRTFSDGIQLTQQPVKELEQLRGTHKSWQNKFYTTGTMQLNDLPGGNLEIIATVRPWWPGQFGLRLQGAEGEALVVGYDSGTNSLFLDRRNCGEAGFHPDFAAYQEGPLPLEAGTVTIRVLIDESSVEVFGNDRTVITSLFFPRAEGKLEFFVEGGAVNVKSLDVWTLRSIW